MRRMMSRRVGVLYSEDSLSWRVNGWLRFCWDRPPVISHAPRATRRPGGRWGRILGLGTCEDIWRRRGVYCQGSSSSAQSLRSYPLSDHMHHCLSSCPLAGCKSWRPPGPNRTVSFLAALLDALIARVHGALATSLCCHLLACLLVCWYRLLASGQHHGVGFRSGRDAVPAFFFSRWARSSSSRSFFSFLAAFRGLTLPPSCHGDQPCRSGGLRKVLNDGIHTFSVAATHLDRLNKGKSEGVRVARLWRCSSCIVG